MQLIRSLSHIQPQHQQCVATIGNFDGMHCGHQKLLAKLVETAHVQQSSSMVILFEPQPREFFTPEKAPVRLMHLTEKLDYLRGLSIDYVLCLRFDQAMAKQSAKTFIQTVLLNTLQLRLLLIGKDFRFGYQRQGDVALLQSMGVRQGMCVNVMPIVSDGKQRTSSTWVRAALAEGDFATVRRLLGRDYSMRGRVVFGQQRGRTIGVPTANIRLKRLSTALNGVYAVQVDYAQKCYRGVANVGCKPTVGGNQLGLEVHLFDFDGDLYGKQLQVRFLHKLRNEQRFATIDLLKVQINQDIIQAKALLV